MAMTPERHHERKVKYGRRHQRMRAALLPFYIGKPCPHCGEVMRADQVLHLDHTADGKSYRGFSHRRCNIRDGGRRGHARQRRTGSAIPPSGAA